MTVAVEAIPSSSIAIVQAPASNRGFVMLQVERKMWLTKPDLRKPVPISPRQRLSGQVAIGDIAATNYAREYEPTSEKDEAIDGELCHVLTLKAKSNEATYDHIRYWISQARLVAVRADFALDGRLLKSARFEYGNQITGPRGGILFVSRMTIRDALADATSVLEYRDIKVRPIPASRFRPENL
jgi:outer membrane lipoprotein-sorting protein